MAHAAGWLFLSLFLVLAALQATSAKHPLTSPPSPLDDVETTFHFPGHDDLKFPIGSPLTVLCHVQNNGVQAVNISAIMGSLNVAYQFHHYVQNFSYKSFGVMVKPDEELTLHYDFEILKDLDTSKEYSLSHTIFYMLEKPSKMRHSTTFFNQTVEIYNATSDFETESVLELAMLLISTLVVVLMVLVSCLPDNAHVKTITLALQESDIGKVLSAATGGSGSSSSFSPLRQNDKKRD